MLVVGRSGFWGCIPEFRHKEILSVHERSNRGDTLILSCFTLLLKGEINFTFGAGGNKKPLSEQGKIAQFNQSVQWVTLL